MSVDIMQKFFMSLYMHKRVLFFFVVLFFSLAFLYLYRLRYGSDTYERDTGFPEEAQLQ